MGKRDQRRRRNKIRQREIENQLDGVRAAAERRRQEALAKLKPKPQLCSEPAVIGTIDETYEEHISVSSERSQSEEQVRRAS